MTQEKLDTKDIDEVLDFAIGVVKDLAKHKSNDGKISTMEYVQTAIGNAPAALKAIQGIDNIDDQFKDMDDEEMKKVAAKGVELSMAVMELLGVSK